MSDIRQWLEELGLGRYADAFEAEQIALGHVPELTDTANGWFGSIRCIQGPADSCPELGKAEVRGVKARSWGYNGPFWRRSKPTLIAILRRRQTPRVSLQHREGVRETCTTPEVRLPELSVAAKPNCSV